MGVQESVKSSASVKIYPNPVKEGFIEIKTPERIEWAGIYNSEGRYFLEIKSQKEISRHPFIKE